jgi:hypothetical protein
LHLVPDAFGPVAFPLSSNLVIVHDGPYDTIIRPAAEHLFQISPGTPSMLEWESRGYDYGFYKSGPQEPGPIEDFIFKWFCPEGLCPRKSK